MDIKEIILRLGEIMTQTQLAEVLGASQATISRLKRGHIPGYDLGKKIESVAFKYNLLILRDRPRSDHGE